jgi:methylthioribose-1-phosphate isomerase
MKVGNKHYRTIWMEKGNPSTVFVIDQRQLPHQFVIEKITSFHEMCTAIKDMHIRGAGLIGAAAGYGMYLAVLEFEGGGSFENHLQDAAQQLKATRPTAIDLAWAVDQQLASLSKIDSTENAIPTALQKAHEIANLNAEHGSKIGEFGSHLIEMISQQKNGNPVNILTHCNAGWLAFVDYGSATAPIYNAFEKGIDIHVGVDETRPRNQGARLTAWELQEMGVPHTIIADNTGGHLMQNGMVDMVIVGSDRTTYTGDVANKIGTYLKALAAFDNDVPFYVSLPSSSIDWEIDDGLNDIPIEQRGDDEVKYIQGLVDGEIRKVLLTPKESTAANYAFDVTPARLVSGLITERGICEANAESIFNLFPEKRKANV